MAQDRSGSLRIAQDHSGSLRITLHNSCYACLLCLFILTGSPSAQARSGSVRIFQNRLNLLKITQDGSGSLRLQPHGSSQALQLHMLQVSFCNSTRFRSELATTHVSGRLAAPHVSCQPLQLHMFQVSPCNSTRFRSTIATPHVSGQPLQLHISEISPCNSTRFRSALAAEIRCSLLSQSDCYHGNIKSNHSRLSVATRRHWKLSLNDCLAALIILLE